MHTNIGLVVEHEAALKDDNGNLRSYTFNSYDDGVLAYLWESHPEIAANFPCELSHSSGMTLDVAQF